MNKNEYKIINNINNNTNKEVKKIENKVESNNTLLIILSASIIAVIILSIINIATISEIYNEIMPKKCECELIIDTDTLTL